MKTTLLRSALSLALATLGLQAALAAELVTADGGRFSLRAVVAPTDGTAGSGFMPSVVASQIAWMVEEPSGQVHEGLIARNGSVRDDLPLLLQNPVDGEVHLIFPAVQDSTKDLFLRTWLGQSWSDPVWLAGTEDGDDLRPRASFTATGEIVLAWSQERLDGSEHVLFQYGLMDQTGMRSRHVHADMGRAEIYTRPVDGDVQLAKGVAHLATDATGDQAYLFLADPMSEDIGVLRLNLRAMRQIGGGLGFIPVPVNFLQVAMGNGPGSLSDRIAEAGELLPSWRIEMLGGEGYYWFGEETMSGLAFREGQARSDLITLDLPEEELQAHARMIVRLRGSLGRIDAQLEPVLAREDARSRRLR